MRAVGAARILLGFLFVVFVFGARPAAAQSFVEEVSDDPCAAVRALEVDDVSVTAEHLRRACRIQLFETRLASERRQEVAAEAQAQQARIAAWTENTQPARALRPIAVEGYLASGLSTYGLVIAWDVLRRLELDARLGWRKMTCWDQFSSDGGDCTRTSYGAGARWFPMDKELSPFVGAGFAITAAHLQILTPQPEGGSKLLTGDGRAHSVNGGGGLQLAVRGVRMSLEYVYEHVYYAGASQNDMQMTPSPDLTAVWKDSLRQDRHGVRFEAGYAF